MSDTVEVGPTHPLWRSWDDDDWNGSTAANWMSTIKSGTAVVLRPSTDVSTDLLTRMCAALRSAGADVVVKLGGKG